MGWWALREGATKGRRTSETARVAGATRAVESAVSTGVYPQTSARLGPGRGTIVDCTGSIHALNGSPGRQAVGLQFSGRHEQGHDAFGVGVEGMRRRCSVSRCRRLAQMINTLLSTCKHLGGVFATLFVACYHASHFHPLNEGGAGAATGHAPLLLAL